MPGPEETLFPKIQGRPTDINIETPRSQVIGEHSRYDPNYYIPIGGLSAQEIQTTRAENQGAWMELGTAAANLIPNTALSIVESTAHLVDLEDWSNMIQGNAANYGNVLTRWASQNKNVFGEVYQKTPGENNIMDSAWWISNGAGLVESVVAFGLTGYGVGSVLGKGASALSKSLNAYGKAKMGLDLAAQVGTSGALAFTEGAMTGAQVFESEFPRLKQLKAEELLNQGIKQYGAENITEEYLKYVDEQSNNYANQLAGESATKAVRINTAINTFLNLPETGALFRSMSANRYLDDALRINRGENIDNYLERINSFDAAKHITREGIKSKVKQMGGETLEEMVNVYAEQEGRNVARKARGEDIVTLADMLADDDIWAAGFWGAVGGSMQGFVMNKMPKSVVQEDGTTKWTTVGAYNKEQVVNKYEEQIGDLKDRLTEYIGAKNDLIKASQTNDQKLYNEAINKIFNYNSFNSIVKGVEEQLIGEYENIMSLSSEEAAQQGFKGDYKQDAAKKIQSVREYTSEWNKIQDRYMSQDLDMAGYPETIFQQFVNVENNKNIITEQEFEINKLQSDINQSYALKGTDLTIAAYNDIVSSIKALENDFDLEAIDLENLMNLDTFDSKTKKRIIAKLNNKYGNLENAKTQIEKNLENIREKARSFQKTFELQRENFDIQVDPENKLSQEEKDQMFARILAENEFEINALTEAKSQLQRNRETLRAQEDELRQLKSKDGVQKFKDLKKQKLAEQDQNTQTEIIQEQQAQAEAEREQRQEVINDIRTRQEEAPETITPEEAITLEELERAEQEELGVQGETYQEGGYTGEGSKPEELRQQYEDISKSANNTDEKGKVVDQNNNPIFVDDKLIFSFDKIAYASTIEYSEDEVSGKIKHTSLQLNPETNPDFLTTKFMPGTPIKLKKLDSKDFKPFIASRKIIFIDELGREVVVANAGETVTFEMLSHPYMQPIGIYDADGKVIGMLHDVTYIRPSRVLQESLEDDRNNLIALRSKIGDTFIETTINGKTNGHINQLRDGFRKLNELIQSPIEFAIATSSIQLNTSKTVIVDGLINKPNYKVGQVYAITYTPNGQKIAIPVKTTQVKEHTNVMNELLAAFDKFAEGKISQNDLKEIFSKYIYSTPTSEKLDAKGKNFKREPDGKDRFYIDFDSLNVNGIVFGKSGDSKKFLSVNTPKDQIEGLRRAFIDILSNSYININFEKLRDTNFVKEFATSNVRFYSLPDGRVTVFDNPVISIGTSFAGEFKPIEKTQEQPRVAPEVPTTPVSDNTLTPIERRTKEELFPIDSLHKGKESGDTLKVIGYTKDGVRFEIQTEGTLKPTKNVILSELKRLIKEGKLSSDVYAELTALEVPVSDEKADIEKRRQEELKADKLNSSLSEFEVEDTPDLKTGSNSKRLNIKKDGKQIGIISLNIDESGNVRIAYMEINETERKKGYAEKFYKDLNEALQKNKQGSLHSDKVWLDDLSKREKRKWFLDGTQLTEEEITALKKDTDKLLELDEQGRLTYEEEKLSDILPAQQLWKKLVKQGVAEKLEDGTYRFKYDAELVALEGKPTTPAAPVSDKKADIERRIQEVENFVNQDFFANSELLSNHWKTKKDLFENKIKQLKSLLQKGIKTGEDLRTLTNLLNDIRGILNEGININNKTAILTNEKNIQELANSLFSLISDDVIKDYIQVMNKAMESRIGSNAVEKMLVGYSDGSGYTIDGKNVEYFLSKETLENAKNNKQINAKYDAELADIEKTLYGTISGSIPLSQALPNGVYTDLGNGLFAYADKNEKIAAIVDRDNNYLVSKSFWNASTNKWQLPNQANLKDDAKRLGIDEATYIKKYQDAVDSLNKAELAALEGKTTQQETFEISSDEESFAVSELDVLEEPAIEPIVEEIKTLTEEKENLIKQKDVLENEISQIEKELEDAEVLKQTKSIDDVIQENVTEVELEKIVEEENLSTTEQAKEKVKEEVVSQMNDKTNKKPKTFLQKVASRIKKILLNITVVATVMSSSSFNFSPSAKSLTYDNATIENLESFDNVKLDQDSLNKLKDINVITSYNKNSNEKYLIVDKNAAMAHLYQGDSLITSYEVGTGKIKGDAQTKTVVKNGKVYWQEGNKQTGAGIYKIKSKGKYKTSTSYTLLNERGIEVSTVLHETLSERKKLFADNDPENNRMSFGCVNFQAKSLHELDKEHPEFTSNSKVYILPDDPNNKFKIVDGKLTFISKNKDVNKTITSYEAQPITVKAEGVNETGKDFLQSLSDNKADIMALYPTISNDEYNQILKIAYGIFGQETSYGTYGLISGQIGRVTDYGQLLSNELLGTKYNPSIGVTQIRYSNVRQEVRDAFNINDISDLRDTEKAAIATMAHLLDIYVNEIPNDLKDKFIQLLPLAYSNHSEFTKYITTKDSRILDNQYVVNVNKNSDNVEIYLGINETSEEAPSKTPTQETSLLSLGLIGLLRRKKNGENITDDEIKQQEELLNQRLQDIKNNLTNINNRLLEIDQRLNELGSSTIIPKPTIEPTVEVKSFTSNNGIEFTPGLDEDDLLPTVTDSEKQIEKSLSLQNKVLNLINEGKITKFCK